MRMKNRAAEDVYGPYDILVFALRVSERVTVHGERRASIRKRYLKTCLEEGDETYLHDLFKAAVQEI